MNIASISAYQHQQIVASANVEVFKGASEQVEAVMAILLKGISQNPRPQPSHKGQNLNISA